MGIDEHRADAEEGHLTSSATLRQSREEGGQGKRERGRVSEAGGRGGFHARNGYLMVWLSCLKVTT